MSKLKFLICFIVISNSAFSQKQLVEGFVKDGDQFLTDVKIYSANQVNKIITRKQIGKKQINTIKTDKNGYFKFEKLKINDSLLFSLCNYKNLKISINDFIKEKTIQLEKEDCTAKKVDSNYNLIAFIGKKLSLKLLPRKNCCLLFGSDSEYLATYKVEKMLYGNFSSDTISFKVYDHYGQPEFSKYENVILYILKKESENIHLKYQFDITYKDINNNWYSPYSYLNNKKEVYKSEVQPEIVIYKEKIKFKLSDNNPEWNINNFPKPYYKIKRNYAIPIFGYKVNDLIKMKLNYFKNVYKLKS